MTLLIRSEHVYTKFGVPVTVTGIAQVKFQTQNEEMLRAGLQQFLGKEEAMIKKVAQETLEGHQRSIMGTLTVEEIYQDRKKFAKGVYEVASSDLVHMGIVVVSYTLKDIQDNEGYLKALGMARTAQVKRDARIGETEARRDAGIREAMAEEERLEATYHNDTAIAKAKRDFELKKAAYDKEVETEKAKSQLAHNLQTAKTIQRLTHEKIQISIVERAQRIHVQNQEILRKERALESMVHKPAEAEKYKMEKLAEANRKKIIMNAEAEAEAIRLKGEADAYAIDAKAMAEAQQMVKKADAWKDYQDAAVIDMVLDMMPRVARAVAAPLRLTRKITMVSNENGEVGVSKFTGEILSVMKLLPEVVHGMTGVDISKAIKATTPIVDV